MKAEKHYELIKESIEVIDECVTHGIAGRQRTIAFNCSAAATDMLEVLLHKKNLIDPGMIIKHDWFLSKNKMNDKLPFEFESKKDILNLMNEIEERRNELCYGTPKEEKEIRSIIERFNKLKTLFIKAGVEIEK